MACSTSVTLLVHVHDLPVWSVPPAQVDRIRRALPDVDVVDVRDDEACRAAIGEADVAVATRMTAGTLALATRLRWVHTTAVGVGGLPVAALAARGITVSNSRAVHAEVIAEHAIALLLALRRQFPTAAGRQATRDWAQHELSGVVVPRLSATHVLILGLGAIGARVASHAAALGMTVTGIRRDLGRPAPPGVTRVEPLTALPDLLPQADAVIVALPHTAETGMVLGVKELALLKPSAVLVNVARGSLVDEEALAQALIDGRLAGAGLDVFTLEPLAATSPLWSAPRTLLTPHTSAFDGDYWTPAIDFFLENMARFRQGQPLQNVIDPRRGY